jgi:hypothetical protein
MSELGETITFALFEPLTAKCPFTLDGPDTADVEAEQPSKDDLEAAEKIQENNGGTLGDNLTAGSPAGWGKSGTINDIYPPPEYDPNPRQDSNSDATLRVTVGGAQYGFIVAAHHLIPGEAALAKSDLYKKYMTAGGQVTTIAGKSYSIKTNIGYNVNGNHNGMWLPGNYAIRKTKPDLNSTGKTWSDLVASDPTWCYAYMTACVEQTQGQFHDSHTKYSDAVLDILDKVHVKLQAHQDTCQQCAGKEQPMYPPYVLKARLYLFSRYLAGQVRVRPGTWKNPWITSDKFKDELMRHGRIEPESVKLGVIAL